MSDIISWDKAIGTKVKSSDDEDLGKVQSITRDYIQTKKGTVSKSYYFIPKYNLSGYDGSKLWIDAPSGLVRSKFEREAEPTAEELRALANDAPRYKRAEPQARAEPDSVTVETKVDVEEKRTTEGA